MQTDETQLWLGNAENSNMILHNIVSHNIEEVRGEQGLIENGDVDSSLVESHEDGDLFARILKSIKSAKKEKKQGIGENNLPVRVQPKRSAGSHQNKP
ncbi:hypothetical protein KY290_033710 [Solanum tuberosum]|uniref:Uncharacterized protein n=1 Tax=Solanum tuberosum TaxID=4113 RepID=A0ABQ7U144_SOLTU|nr:hypothetical protein KY289_033084 [Solanum tuberosum]KAH0647726.1 hypothetical protein KY285_032974 [Solanum tuberosum]KAH0740667.1 hypothetical protein KY290_033710 [Solanum tuberosum]